MWTYKLVESVFWLVASAMLFIANIISVIGHLRNGVK